LDLFSAVPGRDAHGRSGGAMQVVEIDFGPTTQAFHVGAASVAVPGVPRGLATMHERYGRLPMTTIAAPAVAAAQEGLPVTASFERVLELLWPIVRIDPAIADRFGTDGRPLRRGATFRWPELGHTIEQFAAKGPDLIHDGPLSEAIIRRLGDDTRLNRADLTAYEPAFRAPRRYAYRDATVWVPGPPSLAGLLVLQALRALEDHGPMPEPLGAAQLRYIEHAMRRVDHTRKHGARQHLFDPGFVEGFLAAVAPLEVGEEYFLSGHRPPSTGHTTHISIVDDEGNAVGITTSLGETCGTGVSSAGLLLNNFLGEADVYPDDIHLGAGARLMTMCCPTILEIGDQVYVMGSGGSSRIRSAVLHGIVYLTDHGMAPDQVVLAPRAHVEDGVLLLETNNRPRGTVAS
ncbi:MAG: gamma-glutamyltransferase, partial [Myxococcota bacterium]|nr:gamma-glutamyltransferase [Myxococcota bacterium]